MATATAIAGVELHPEAVRVYRERTPRSRELLGRLREVIPTGQAGGMWYQLPYPTVLERGKGSHVWDVDGNEYLDFRIGDWLLIHGHCNDHIRDAIVEQLDKAVQFGAPEWDLSYRMATALIERVPSVEKVRFTVSGTETNQLAIRLARAYTGRQKMAKMTAGYHGVSDQLLIANGITYDGNALPAGIVVHSRHPSDPHADSRLPQPAPRQNRRRLSAPLSGRDALAAPTRQRPRIRKAARISPRR